MMFTKTTLARRTTNARAMASGMTILALLAGLAGFAASESEARPALGGRSFSVPRGGGFGGVQAGSGFQRPNGVNGQQRTTGAQRNGGYARNGNTGTVGGTRANSGAIGSGNGNRANNTGVVGSGNGNTGYAYNSGNVAVGNDVNVNVDNGNSGWSGYNGYAVGASAAYATGVAVGTNATTLAVGSYYATLPAHCSPYHYSSFSYYACGGTWYQARYQSGSTVYVVVSDPTKK